MSKLKSCPFCGGSNLGYSIKIASKRPNDAVYHVSVYCKSCNCYGSRVLTHINPKSFSEDDFNEAKKEASELWNNRA